MGQTSKSEEGTGYEAQTDGHVRVAAERAQNFFGSMSGPHRGFDASGSTEYQPPSYVAGYQTGPDNGWRASYNNGHKFNVEANPNLYVHNVPKDSNEEELRLLFGRYGTVERIRLKVNQKVGPHAVYAFVTFQSVNEAQLALNNLQGADLRGRSLRIEFQRTSSGPQSQAQAQTPTTNIGGSRGGFDAPPPPAASTEPTRTPPNSTSAPKSSSTGFSDGPTRLAQQLSTTTGDAFATRPETTETSDWGQTADWGAQRYPHMSTRPLAPREHSSDYMPPQKRGRFHSPNTRPDQSPSKPTMMRSPDLPSLLATLRNVVQASHPEALDLVQNLIDVLLGPARVWPTSELSSQMQTLVRNRTLTLDPETNRWRVALSPVLEPLKPGLFARRQKKTPTPTTQTPVIGLEATPLSTAQVLPHPVKPAPPATEETWSFPPPAQQSAQMQPEPLPPQPISAPSQSQPPILISNSTIPQTSLAEEAANWSKRLQSMEVTPFQDRVVVWNGILARNEKKRIPIVVKRLVGHIEKYMPTKSSMLNISHRSALEEVYKKVTGAVGLLEASSPEGARGFQEYIQYFQEKNRAGVVRFQEQNDSGIIYLLPVAVQGVAETISAVLPNPPADGLLAIVARTTSGGSDAEGGGRELGAVVLPSMMSAANPSLIPPPPSGDPTGGQSSNSAPSNPVGLVEPQSSEREVKENGLAD